MSRCSRAKRTRKRQEAAIAQAERRALDAMIERQLERIPGYVELRAMVARDLEESIDRALAEMATPRVHGPLMVRWLR